MLRRRLTLLLVLLPCLMRSPSAALPAQEYRHKSESELARMTPAQRVDEWVGEQVHHRYDLEDEHEDTIKKYVLRDGLAALPRMIEIMDEYDPTRFREGEGRRGERFDACWLMLGYIDSRAVRLRASGEGRRAMDALDRAVNRMRAAGYGRKDQHEWEQHGRFELAVTYLEEAKGINQTDRAIRETFWVRHRFWMSDEELLALSNFLVARDPAYPAWSEQDFIKDYTRINEAGNPAQRYVMRKPERFYETYLEFKQTRR
jgi:hypothetical protein